MAGIITAAAIAGGVGLIAADMQAGAVEDAAGLSRQNALDTNALSKLQYDQSRYDQKPYRQSGIAAQNRLLTLLGLDVPQGQNPVNGLMGGSGAAGGSGYLPQSTEPQFIDSPQTDGEGNSWVTQVPNPRYVNPGMQVDKSEGTLNVNRNSPDFGKYARDFSMADFEQDPGYAFRLREGIKALENSASARGGLNSGSTGKALIRYGQEAGSQEFGNAFSRYQTNRTNQLNALQSLTGQSLTSATNTGAAGQRYAEGVANTNNQTTNSINESRAAGSNARTSGYVGVTNQLTGLVNQYNKNQQDQEILNRLLPRSVPQGNGFSFPSGMEM